MNAKHLPRWDIMQFRFADEIGYLPEIILAEQFDPRPVVEQVNDRYAHGGGWHRFNGFMWNRIAKTLRYPGDPPVHAIARFVANAKETVYVFHSGWTLIDRGGDDWEVARLD